MGRVLIACEESQTVCKAFRKLGHEAYSCDLQACSGGHPEWHIIADVLTIIKGGWFVTQAGKLVYIEKWDLMIAHPPCTYFSRAGIQFIHTQQGRIEKQREAFEFVKKIWAAPIELKALENPVGWLCTNWRRPSQKIHPWYFGDPEMKETCLWLNRLPRLQGLHEVALNINKYHPKPESYRIGSDGKMKNKYFMQRAGNAKNRSKTFPGIARAMAEQWGKLL